MQTEMKAMTAVQESEWQLKYEELLAEVNEPRNQIMNIVIDAIKNGENDFSYALQTLICEMIDMKAGR